MGKEKKNSEEITLERHIWRAMGIFIACEGVRIFANGIEAKNDAETIEHLVLGLGLALWFIWGQGASATLGRATGSRHVREDEFQDWLPKDINALVGLFKDKK